MIAEIVSLSAYESQVSALLNEDERMAMEFDIACAPEVHPVIPGAGGFRKARWADKAWGRAAVCAWFISSWPNQDGSTWLPFSPNPERRTFRPPIKMCSRNLRHRSRKQRGRAIINGRAYGEHRNQEANQARQGAGAERQRNSSPHKGRS